MRYFTATHLSWQHYTSALLLHHAKDSRRKFEEMVSLNCLSINKLQILASSPPNSTSASIPPQASSPEPSHPTIPITAPPPRLQKLQQQQQQQPKLKQKRKQKQPSIMEIEKAIGAGSFRDRDPIRDSEEKKSLFDTILSTESSAEKQLREAGEWITDKTEATFRSAGKPILILAIQWMLPLWLLAFCVAAGIIKLPFDSPLLDDLIM